MTSCELVLVVADVTVTLTFNLNQSELRHFLGKLLIGQPTTRAARQTERKREPIHPPRAQLMLVVFMIILR